MGSYQNFSYKIYANVIVLFAGANAKNCNKIVSVLNRFVEESGLRVNYSKNQEFTSLETLLLLSGTTFLVAQAIIIILVNTQKDNYRISDIQFLVDKVKDRVSAWNTMFLFFAGRVIPTTSIVSALLMYHVSQQNSQKYSR